MSRLLRSEWLLLIGAGIGSLGLAFLWPLTALYVHRVLREPMTVAGLILTGQSAAGLIGSLIGGWLFDRRGARWPLAVVGTVSGLALLTVAMDGGVAVYAVAVMVVGLAMGVAFPIFNAMAGELWAGRSQVGFNAVYVAQNAGVAIGSSLGGYVASIGFRYTFLTAAVSGLLLAALAVQTYRGAPWEKAAPKAPHRGAAGRVGGIAAARGLGWPILWLAAGLALDWVAYGQWEITVPNFMVGEGFSLPSYSLLWTVNTVLILAAQPVAVRLVALWRDMRMPLVAGSAMFFASFVLLAADRTYPAYVAAMVVGTVGEMLVLPGVPAAAAAHAPEERRGLVQGVVGMSASFGRMVGPLIGGALYAPVDPIRVFGVMTVAYGLAAGAYVLGTRRRAAAGDVESTAHNG
jgi:MFS family permease